MGDKMAYLYGILIMEHQFRVPDCNDGFIRQQGHSGAVGQYDAPSMRTIQAGCFNRGCTLRDAKFFWRSCNKQDSQYCRNQATLNIQVAKRFLTEKARQGDW